MSTDITLPAYLAQRIRRPIPAASAVVPGSTPVVAFGNARRATVATLGLNPSKVEFLDRSGLPFPDDRRRLETATSLGITQLDEAPDALVARVVAGCDRYFQCNPYWQWFRPLDGILAGLGTSYSNGTACHLDLVQWATDPVWGGLAPSTRQALIEADAPFLREQLTQDRISTLLLNGRGVIDTFTAAYGVALKTVRSVTDKSVTANLVAGFALGSIMVVGWSTNLQSSFGVTRVFRERLRDEVAAQVAVLARAGS